MKSTHHFCAFAAIVCVMFFSCASGPEERIDSVYVMVYGEENTEIMGATVYLDGKSLGSTDIYGRFTFPYGDGGDEEHSLRVEKSGYEAVSNRCPLRGGQVVYFNMQSGAGYAKKAEKCVDEGNLEMAGNLIDKALRIEERKDWRFLKDVIEERMGK